MKTVPYLTLVSPSPDDDAAPGASSACAMSFVDRAHAEFNRYTQRSRSPRARLASLVRGIDYLTTAVDSGELAPLAAQYAGSWLRTANAALDAVVSGLDCCSEDFEEKRA
jgi:hypothetical protein